jgi:RNA polymerase sigma factor (sigma-70 family)
LPPENESGQLDPTWRQEMLEREFISQKLLQGIEVILQQQRQRLSWEDLLNEAQEVHNEVVVRGLQRVGQFDLNRAGALSWLMGIAVNVIRERRRRQGRDRARCLTQSSLGEAQWGQILERLSSERPQADTGEMQESVRAALGKLSPDQQEVLRLRYVEQLPWKEVGERLGVNENAANVRGVRALRALRALLGL